MGLAPFQRLPFGEVPELPRVPHPYFETPAETVPVVSEGFGRVDVHLRIAGSGPPLLLVHDFMTTGYSWRYAIAPLAERHTVYVPDLVGSGRSGKPEASYHPDALADFVGATMDALAIRGAAVVGNSLGGYLCMRLALRDPGAMSRLVNLHSPGLPTARMWALRSAPAITPGWAAALRRVVQRDPERWVHRNVHYYDETLKSREEHREYAAPLATAEGFTAFARMLAETMDVRAMRRFEADLRARSGFPIPLCLVYATRDPMVPPVVGERLHALLPGGEFLRLDEASHFAHVDATDRLLRAIHPFLQEGRSVR